MINFGILFSKDPQESYQHLLEEKRKQLISLEEQFYLKEDADALERMKKLKEEEIPILADFLLFEQEQRIYYHKLLEKLLQENLELNKDLQIAAEKNKELEREKTFLDALQTPEIKSIRKRNKNQN